MDQVKPEQLNFEPMEHSMKLTVTNHMERNHVLHFQNLAYKIKPGDCTCKVRRLKYIVFNGKLENLPKPTKST